MHGQSLSLSIYFISPILWSVGVFTHNSFPRCHLRSHYFYRLRLLHFYTPDSQLTCFINPFHRNLLVPANCMPSRTLDLANQSLIMPPPTDRYARGIMFSGCTFVSASVRPSVHSDVRPVSTISYKPIDGISSNFAWWCIVESSLS